MVRLALLLTLHSAVALAAALVSWLVSTTLLDRAVKVLEAVDLPPHAYDIWTDHLDVDFDGLAIIGQVK